MAQRQSVTINGYSWFYSAAATAFPALTAGATVQGKAGVNTQFSGAGHDTLIGGGGGADNIFFVTSSDTAVAGSSDGLDTVVSYWGNLTLGRGMANGIIKSPGTLTGNSGDNILTATGAGAHTLVGGGGNDLLIGAAGSPDRYVTSQAAGGNETVAAFEHGSDVVELDGFAKFATNSGGTFATVQAALSQAGSNVVLDLGDGQSVTFANQTVAQFTAKDFALPISTAGLKMTFDDEFNGLSASASGAGTNWKFLSGPHGTGEVENYLASSGPGSPFSVSGGVLDITASPNPTAPGLPYTSGGLTTKSSFSQTYGYFETRAELPAGAGLWPAFWLMPADGSWPPELDAPEQLGNDPTTLYFSTHSTTQATQTVAVKVPDTSQGFHTYGVDWEPKTITYYFDGNAVATLATPADLNKPMYLLLNLAVGAAGSWAGAASGETGHLLVDYVRAYASPTAAQPPLMLVNWGMTIHEGDGSYAVGGTGGGGTIILGSGNQTVKLTGSANAGSQNSITTGDGSQAITAVGNANTIHVGAGTSTVAAGVSFNHVTAGAVAAGSVTRLSATGGGNVFTATGPGDFAISGASTTSTVTLGDGNQSVSVGGGSNVVTLGRGNSVVTTGSGQNTVHTGAGSSTITVFGYHNILDAGPGTNVLNGGSGSDIFILNGAGQGVDLINGFGLTKSDILDFTRALSGLPVKPDLAGFSRYVSAAASPGGTVLSIDPSGHGGSGQAIAVLGGVKATLPDLLSHMEIRIGNAVL